MSLMGYQEQDVLKMMDSIAFANNFIVKHPSDLMNKEPLLTGLQNAYDFFDCLIIEGRV